MKRSRSSRALLAIWALWLAAAFTYPTQVFTCAMHGETGARMQDMRGRAAAGTNGVAPAPAGGGGTHDGHGVCSCMGDCCGAAVVGLLGRATELVAAAEHDVAVAEYATVGRRADRAAEHVLPYANGPPARSVV